jgi:formate dehydrogenase subunit gamma
MSTNAVPRTAAAPSVDQQLITRYTFAERINHWLGALTYIYLLITGLAFWSPYLYWMAAIVGGGPTARFSHPWVGLLFTASVFWTTIEWYRDMLIDDDDREWALEIDFYIKNEDEKLPPVGRFNWGQKLFFWGMFYSAVLLLLSGFGLWFTEDIPWKFHLLRFAIILVHASVALITIGLFLIHVYMSTVLEEGSFGSMVSGKVTRAWAWTFHRKWYYKVAGDRSTRE